MKKKMRPRKNTTQTKMPLPQQKDRLIKRAVFHRKMGKDN